MISIVELINSTKCRRKVRRRHIPTGKVCYMETVQECTLANLLAQVNEWNRQLPGHWVYWVPERTQPEIAISLIRDAELG